MENLAGELFTKTGTAVVVATVKTIGDSDPETYAMSFCENWGIGKKGEDKGVLIFLALQERRVGLKQGSGLKGYFLTGSLAACWMSMLSPILNKIIMARDF